MAQAHWELHAWIMIMLAWVFVPFYYRAGVFKMPEFLEKRFDSRSRRILSIVSLITYVLTKVSVTVYAGALVFRTLLPYTFGTPDDAFWVGAFTTVILTGIYTVFGGLRAVLAVTSDQFAFWRPNSDPTFPWLGVMIASPIVGIWYWCTDQYIVQRTLAARSLTDARRGAIFGGFL